MPLSKWFTKLVSKPDSPLDASTSAPINASSNDWVGNAIQAAKVTAAAGELAPFPFIKGAAGVFVALLEPVQRLKQNQDDFKTLTGSITSILNILHEEVKAQPEAAKNSVQFNTLCAEFKACLDKISNDIRNLSTLSRTKQYIRANQIQTLLIGYRTEIDQFHSNLLLSNTSFTRLRFTTWNSRQADHIRDEYAVNLNEFTQVKMGDIFIVNEIPHPPSFCDQRGVEKEAEIADANARIPGSSNMPVVIRTYKGENAQEAWKRDFEIHSKLKHSQILQLYGVCNVTSMPSLIFHGESLSTPIKVELHQQGTQECIKMYRWSRDISAGCEYLREQLHGLIYCQYGIIWDWYTVIGATIVSQLDARGRVYLSMNWSSSGFPSHLDIVASARNIHISDSDLDNLKMVWDMCHSQIQHLSKEDGIPLLRTFLTIRTPGRGYYLDPPPENIYFGRIFSRHKNKCNKLRSFSEFRVHPIGRIKLQGRPTLKWDSKGWAEVTTGLGEEVSTIFRTIIGPSMLIIFWITYWYPLPEIYQSLLVQLGQLHRKLGLHPNLQKSHEFRVVGGVMYTISIPLSALPAWSKGDNQVPVYLFMRLYQTQDDGFCRTPEVYWSRRFDGVNPMNELDEMVHGLPRPTVSGYVDYVVHNTSEDNQVLEFYKACGFDPNSDELARQFNLPVIQYLPSKPFIPRRRHSISNLAEFTIQSGRKRRRLPISIRKIPNHELPTTDLDWMDLAIKNKEFERLCLAYRKGWLDIFSDIDYI